MEHVDGGLLAELYTKMRKPQGSQVVGGHCNHRMGAREIFEHDREMNPYVAMENLESLTLVHTAQNFMDSPALLRAVWFPRLKNLAIVCREFPFKISPECIPAM